MYHLQHTDARIVMAIVLVMMMMMIKIIIIINCAVSYVTNSNRHVTQFVIFLLQTFCDLSDRSNCSRTIMYVTIVDAH